MSNLIEKLHKALRKIAIKERSSEGRGTCMLCKKAWRRFENHAVNCLAGPNSTDEIKNLQKDKPEMLAPPNTEPLLKLFLKFVGEREIIRLKRVRGESAPWTEDKVLKKYRFCNVRRKDDRVSAWLLKHYYVRTSPATQEQYDTWFWAAVARLINWPPTLMALMEKKAIPYRVEEYDSKKFAAALENIHKKNPIKTYTGAYMLYAGGRAANNKMVKSSFIAHHLLSGLVANKDEIRAAIARNSIRDTVDALRQSHGVSTFMAGQIAADLSYLPELENAIDLHNYAPQGPGSLRGLNRLKCSMLNRTWDTDLWNKELMELNERIKSDLKITDLTLHDVQNCLCEFDKYMRTITGEGRPRSEYKPETAY